MKRLSAILFWVCVLLPAANAGAVDIPLDADGLYLRRTPGGPSGRSPSSRSAGR